MEPRRIIRTDIAASVVAHLTLVALIVLISEVHPFQAPPSDMVAVDIVTPEELKEKLSEPAPSPQIPLPDLTAKDAKDKAEASASSSAPPPSPPQPTQEAPPQPTQQASPQPLPSPQP